MRIPRLRFAALALTSGIIFSGCAYDMYGDGYGGGYGYGPYSGVSVGIGYGGDTAVTVTAIRTAAMVMAATATAVTTRSAGTAISIIRAAASTFTTAIVIATPGTTINVATGPIGAVAGRATTTARPRPPRTGAAGTAPAGRAATATMPLRSRRPRTPAPMTVAGATVPATLIGATGRGGRRPALAVSELRAIAAPRAVGRAPELGVVGPPAAHQHDRDEGHHDVAILIGDRRLRAERAHLGPAPRRRGFQDLPCTCSVSPG